MNILRALLLSACVSLVACGQTATVTKTPGTNAIKEDLAFGSGRTLSISTGGTLDVTGATLVGFGAGTGDVTGQSSSVDGEIALFSGTTGKIIKRATTTGLLKSTSGVLSAAVAGTDYVTPSAVNGYFGDPTTNGSFSASTWRSGLGLVIGTNVQGYSSYLSDVAQTGQYYVIAGDSLSDVSWSDSQPEIGNGNVWSELMLTYPSFSGRGTAVQTAVQGRKIANLASNYATEVYPYRPGGASGPAIGKKSFLFVFVGINDIGVTSLATMKSSWTSYVSTARTDGFTVVAFTILRRSTFDSTNDSDRLAFNDHIRSSANWDYLVDAAALFPSSDDTTWIYDGTHMTAAANAWLARYVNSVIASRAIPTRSPFNISHLTVIKDATIGGTLYGTTNLDANQYLYTGTRTAFSGGGGNVRYRDDTGAFRWLSGILGSGGATAFTVSDVANSQDRITIASSAGSTANATFTLNGTFTGTLLTNSNLKIATNGAYLQGTKFGGAEVSLLRVTADNPSITRYLVADDAGGFAWTDQAQSTNWMTLSSSGLDVKGTIEAGSSNIVLTDLTGKILSAALNIVQPAQGGTGLSSLGTGVANALGNATNSMGGLVTFSGNLGTPTAGNLTNATDLPIVAGTTGTLTVARGGTGQTSYTNGQILVGNTTSGGLDKTTITAGTGATVTNAAGSITISAPPPSIPANITSNTTLDSTHRNKWLRVNSATDVTLTINASTFAAEDEIFIEQVNSGKAILANSSFTLNKSTANATISTRAQYSVIGIKAISTSVGTVFGDVTQ